jgi:hypothetical protein
MIKVDPTSKAAAMKRLKRNVEELLGQLGFNGPDLMVAHRVKLIIRAAFCYCPNEMGEAMAKLIAEGARTEMGACISCGVAQSPSDEPRVYLCSACEEAIEAATFGVEE